MATEQHVTLDRRPGNFGRWGTVTGHVSSRVGRVSVLVFSHDEQWYHQKPALLPADSKNFETSVAFGLDELSPQGREYIIVAVVGPDLPAESVYRSLNSLPPGCILSAPISVHRLDLF